MDNKEYIEREAVLAEIEEVFRETDPTGEEQIGLLNGHRIVRIHPSADVAPVVRCKDCKWFVPKHIRLDDGSTREYTEEEKKLPLGVPGNVGINCGSRCMRYISWLENSVPVWVQENDFCSYGERKEATP